MRDHRANLNMRSTLVKLPVALSPSRLLLFRRGGEAVSQEYAERFTARFDSVALRPFVDGRYDRFRKPHRRHRITAGCRAPSLFLVYRY
jgi:hypothetical protein